MTRKPILLVAHIVMRDYGGDREAAETDAAPDGELIARGFAIRVRQVLPGTLHRRDDVGLPGLIVVDVVLRHVHAEDTTAALAPCLRRVESYDHAGVAGQRSASVAAGRAAEADHLLVAVGPARVGDCDVVEDHLRAYQRLVVGRDERIHVGSHRIHISGCYVRPGHLEVQDVCPTVETTVSIDHRSDSTGQESSSHVSKPLSDIYRW
jgi:hypothetical protein